jgi:hypothetical protein
MMPSSGADDPVCGHRLESPTKLIGAAARRRLARDELDDRDLAAGRGCPTAIGGVGREHPVGQPPEPVTLG